MLSSCGLGARGGQILSPNQVRFRLGGVLWWSLVRLGCRLWKKQLLIWLPVVHLIATNWNYDHPMPKILFWEILYNWQKNCRATKGLMHYLTLATKHFEVVLLRKDITQLEQKNSSPWYTCDQSLHRVSAISVHYFWRYEHFTEHHYHFSWSDFVACNRNLWTTKIHFCQYLRTWWIIFKTDFCIETLGSSRFEHHESYNHNYHKVSVLFRGFCLTLP